MSTQIEHNELVRLPALLIGALLAVIAGWWAIRVRWNRFWEKRREPEGGEWSEGKV